MKGLTLDIITRVCGGTFFGIEEDKGKSPDGVVLDSRKIEKNYLFIATRGERVDGHGFIPQVLKQGALCALGEDEPGDFGGAYIRVDDSFQALKDIAEYYRQQLDITVIGISGSVGKTTTKEFVSGVLSRKYSVLKTEGNFNNEVGLPLTVLRMKPEHEAAVLEMGISHFGEMHRLSKIARPDICVLTNIGQCHLEYLGSREGILKAKTEMFDYMAADGRVCVNGDDDMLRTIEKVKNREPFTFGMSEANNVYATDVLDEGLLGSRARIHAGGESFPVEIPLPGSHMVYNALCAASVGYLMGLGAKDIAAGIRSVQAVGGRSHVIQKNGLVILDDCYNANPVSMKAAIDLLGAASGKKTAILGDMFELGAKELSLHSQIGAYAVEKGIDELICIGALSHAMYREALARRERLGKEIKLRYYPDLEHFLEHGGKALAMEGSVLVKASNGMHFEKIVSALQS